MFIGYLYIGNTLINNCNRSISIWWVLSDNRIADYLSFFVRYLHKSISFIFRPGGIRKYKVKGSILHWAREMGIIYLSISWTQVWLAWVLEMDIHSKNTITLGGCDVHQLVSMCNGTIKCILARIIVFFGLTSDRCRIS